MGWYTKGGVRPEKKEFEKGMQLNRYSKTNEEQEGEMKNVGFASGLSVVVILMSAMCVLAAPGGTDTSLQGIYSVNGTSVCVQTPYGLEGDPAPTGFLPDNGFLLLLPGNVRTRHITGVLVLNKNGTGTFYEKLMQIYHQSLNPGNFPVNAWEGECFVSYGTLPDGSLEMRLDNCVGQNIAGAGALGASGSFSTILSVATSASGDVLLLSDVEPWVETVWNANPGYPTRYAERICTRSLTAVRTR